MTPEISSREQNLLLLESLMPVDERLYIWCFNREGEYIDSSCPARLQSILLRAAQALGVLEKALNLAAGENGGMPQILGSVIGMQWAVTMEVQHDRELIYLIGPVFYSFPDEKQILSTLLSRDNGLTGVDWIQDLQHAAADIPILPFVVFSRYVLMVHNTLTGQQLGLEAFVSPKEGHAETAQPAGERNRIRVYQSEQALLQMVRSGNINYHRALQNSIAISPGVPVQGKDPLRQMKTSIIVFASLVCRAAMEGGLSPEIAYPLGDSYIQAAEDCRDSGELTALAPALYHDFIYRVHYARANPNYSHAIQKCCDYIELSLDRRVRAADLAALVGYTEYYLTEKFKKETGKTVTAYIRDKKIEHAKILLQTTNLSIASISDSLAFNTPNYFIQCFRQQEGMTPAVFRNRLPSDTPETV